MGVRKYEMDWVRVLVFDVLIVWHAALFFVSWESLVQWDLPMKNRVQVEGLALPMLFVRQWRLPILFVVSGMGSRFALSDRSGWTFLKNRILRLLLPCAFGILVVVPPQIYLERVSQGTFAGSYFQFYPRFFQGVYPEGNFSWQHLWFLPYLFLMTLVALPLFLWVRKRLGAGMQKMGKVLKRHPVLLFVPVGATFLVELTLEKRFPLTMALTDDWYAFSSYFLCFLTGFLLASSGEAVWEAFRKVRSVALLCGVLSWPLVRSGILQGSFSPVLYLAKALHVWSWILAIFGFASRYLNRPSSLLRYRNRAVYPLYILHYTILLWLAFLMGDRDLPVLLKLPLLVLGTYGISGLLYEFVIRRVSWIGLLFGYPSVKCTNTIS
ncbi:MAG: acyltransferase family protein [Bacteroidales bacterium]